MTEPTSNSGIFEILKPTLPPGSELAELLKDTSRVVSWEDIYSFAQRGVHIYPFAQRGQHEKPWLVNAHAAVAAGLWRYAEAEATRRWRAMPEAERLADRAFSHIYFGILGELDLDVDRIHTWSETRTAEALVEIAALASDWGDPAFLEYARTIEAAIPPEVHPSARMEAHQRITVEVVSCGLQHGAPDAEERLNWFLATELKANPKLRAYVASVLWEDHPLWREIPRGELYRRLKMRSRGRRARDQAPQRGQEGGILFDAVDSVTVDHLLYTLSTHAKPLDLSSFDWPALLSSVKPRLAEIIDRLRLGEQLSHLGGADEKQFRRSIPELRWAFIKVLVSSEDRSVASAGSVPRAGSVPTVAPHLSWRATEAAVLWPWLDDPTSVDRDAAHADEKGRFGLETAMLLKTWQK